MKIPGIYRIQFPTGHYYIGSSIDYVSRCKSHVNAIKRGEHDSQRVQNTYNKYKSLPIYGLVVACSKDELLKEEQDLLDAHVGNKLCLNISKCAESARRGVKGKHHSEEWKKRMSEKMKMRLFTEEHRKRISEAKKGDLSNYFANCHSEEANNKRKKALKGRIITSDHRKKISETLRGHKPAFSKSVICLNTGQVFNSITLAQRITGAKAIGRACEKGYAAGRMDGGEPMKWAFHENV